MGICSKAKEIVYAKNISDIKVENKENENNNNNEGEKIDNDHYLKGTGQKTEIPEENSHKPIILENEKRKNKLKFRNFSNKKVGFLNELSSENNEKNNNTRKRGKSAVCRDQVLKFKRSSQKSATLIQNNNILMEKLRGVEMKISVIQETLITQKFGDPDKYYKKIKDLGSGSYGSVYKAKNIIMENTYLDLQIFV